MPLPIEELALKDVIKHPKLIMLYAAFVGIGWLADRMIPTQSQKDMAQCQQAFYKEQARGDSLQRSKDELFNQLLQQKGINKQQHEIIKTTDSLLTPLGHKAKQILRKKSHEH